MRRRGPKPHFYRHSELNFGLVIGVVLIMITVRSCMTMIESVIPSPASTEVNNENE